MAASEADPSQPSTQAIRSVKGQRAVNSLYQFDYTYKTKTPGKPSREKTATETISAFSISEAKEKAKAAIMKDLTDDPTVLRSTISISQPEIKGQFAVTELTGKPADPKSPKIVLNPGTPEKFKSMFNAVDAALDLVKDSPALGLDSDGWIKAYSRALNGSRAAVPPAPLRLAQWVQDNNAFKTFIDEGMRRNPELIKSAVGGLNALQPIHELARQGQIPSKMVALHMFWGLLSRMLDPYNQEAGWARLTSEPKVLRLIEDSVEGRYKFSKDQWKEIVSTKMSEFPDVSVGRNAIQNANAFHEMLSRWNGRWDELTGIINNPDLTGPQMRRQFNEKGFGGAGIKHKVLSFVLATLARNDVFVGDRWQVVNLWFQHLEKAAAARKAQGGSTEVFAYDRNGVPEDTTGAYKVIGGMLNNETVAETAYSLIENGMRKIAAESPWLREMLGREPQPFDIHWLTWNIIKNEPVGHSSLDATAKFLTENLYGDPEFAQKFAETEKRTEKYAKGVFDVFSVKGQERPQIRQRSGADDGGTGAAGLGPDAGRNPGGPTGPSAAAAGAGEVGGQRYMPSDTDYLSAVKQGDTKAAQRMVDEAAKAAGYTIGPVYHGTPTGGFNVFDKRMRGETSGVSRQAFSFTTDKKAAEGYSKRLGDEAVRLDAGLRVANDAMRMFDEDIAAQEYFSSKGYSSVDDGMLPEFDWGSIDDVPEFIKELRGYAKDLKPINANLANSFVEAAKVMASTKAVPEVKRVFLRISENAPVFQATPATLGQVMSGFSAEKQPTKAGIVELPGGDRIYYVADSSQVKLADPVTKDSQGNVIPLSQRFKATSEDIRYMPAGDMATGRSVKDHREAMDLFEKGYRLYGALYDGMEDPIRLKKASEIERFDPENLWAVPSKKIAAAISVRNMPADIQRDIGRNQDFANPPTDAEAVDALSSEKKAKFGAARSIKPGTQVAARIDIPAFLRTGKYVVAVHEPDGAAGGPGKVIGYDTVTRLQNPKFVVKPGVQRIYEGKSAKFPVATVDGKIMADRSIPADLENYVPVGMDPKEHAYFYDKRTDQPVIGGSESVSVGNTVFVKNPVYGDPSQFAFMPSPDSAMPGAYSFPGGYRALPGKAKGSLRLYGPAGSLIGIAASLDEAQRILRRKNK